MKRRRYLWVILIILILLLLFELVFRQGVLRNSLANMLFKAGSYDKAAELYDSNQDDAIAKANKGKARYKEGRIDEAKASFDEALAQTQRKSELLYDRGNAAFANKDYEAAVQDFSEALLYDSKDKDAKANLELALRKLEENPPQQQEQQNQPEEQERSEEEVRNILEALDNKEAQDRKEQQPQSPLRGDNWW
ncbi:MAG TPA: tetratricopeptide repeat protein [Candidatus Cloacimonadota bacterium]|nr:tetratricopeptide repeat protein [Candidatus Cloacimonadota bacterium]